MNNLWTSTDAILATAGKSEIDWVVTGLSIDTRDIQKGDMFIALKDQRDGHDFVAEALKKGATAALVSYIPEGVPKDAPLLIVDDVLTGLADLARFARARTKAKVIGVTGSVGKTGTKEMLITALSSQGKVHAAERSFNNHWGVPLTLARMPKNTDFAVIEIGMNHANEITPLAKMADLDVAIITIVAPVHMAAFKDVNEIAYAKAEIFDGLRIGGYAIINGDDLTCNILLDSAKKAQAKVIVFGKTEHADFKLVQAKIIGLCTTVSAEIDGASILFKLSVPGKHLGMNAMAVLACVQSVGADLAQSMLALQKFSCSSGRGSRETIHLDAENRLELIDESYNANPTSMVASLDVLAASIPQNNVGNITKGRRIAILGDMLELGDDEIALHSNLADVEAMDDIDIIHTVGSLMQALHFNLPSDKKGEWVEDAKVLARKIHQFIDAGDVIMVKGSNGSRVSIVVDAIKKLNKDSYVLFSK